MICHGSREGEAWLHNIKAVRGVTGFTGSTTSGKTTRIRNISFVGTKKITVQRKNCRGGGQVGSKFCVIAKDERGSLKVPSRC
jgi:hypothetical protein